MIHNVFSVHDVKAGAYLPPFILPKSQMALRVFSDCINSDEHQFGKHPADYTLFCLGTFDDSTGQFVLLRGAESLGNGVEFVQIQAKDEYENAETSQTVKPVSHDTSILPSPESGDSEE